MTTIRVVWGAAAGRTSTLSYDAALADAGVHNYNLVRVSSVIPEGATVEAVGTAPDLGPVGGRLTVVQARATVPPGEADPAVAGLGWATDPEGKGILYEGSGSDPDAVAEEVGTGLAGGGALRDWALRDEDRRVARAAPDLDSYTTAVVLAVYGTSDPV